MLLGKLVASLVYRVKPSDPLAFGAASVLLVIAAILACIIPAHRASKVEPMKALREE